MCHRKLIFFLLKYTTHIIHRYLFRYLGLVKYFFKKNDLMYVFKNVSTLTFKKYVYLKFIQCIYFSPKSFQNIFLQPPSLFSSCFTYATHQNITNVQFIVFGKKNVFWNAAVAQCAKKWIFFFWIKQMCVKYW